MLFQLFYSFLSISLHKSFTIRIIILKGVIVIVIVVIVIVVVVVFDLVFPVVCPVYPSRRAIAADAACVLSCPCDASGQRWW